MEKLVELSLGMQKLAEFLLQNRDKIGPAQDEFLWFKFPPDPQRVSINRAAAYLGKSRRTVARSVRRLEECGLLPGLTVP